MIADLKKVAIITNSNNFTKKTYSQFGCYSPETIVRNFGSWIYALEKVFPDQKTSFIYELRPLYKTPSEKEIIDDLIRVAKLNNKETVTKAEYSRDGKFNSEYIARKFNSWLIALERANLKQSRTKMYLSEEELFKNIEEVWTKLGRQPKYVEMRPPLSKYTYRPYERRFGTWYKALQCFVDRMNAEGSEEHINNQTNITTIEEKGEIIIHRTKRDISDRLRFMILMRDGFTCQSCGKSPVSERGVVLHVDHIIPWSKGGETTPENLVTKCKQCNLGKGNAFNV